MRSPKIKLQKEEIRITIILTQKEHAFLVDVFEEMEREKLGLFDYLEHLYKLEGNFEGDEGMDIYPETVEQLLVDLIYTIKEADCERED